MKMPSSVKSIALNIRTWREVPASLRHSGVSRNPVRRIWPPFAGYRLSPV
jgi:hypothetical protein